MINIVAGSENIALMETSVLGKYVEEQMSGICHKLIELKPYIAELWIRFDRKETVNGCKTKKQFCEQILHRKLQTVRLMLSEAKGQLETSSGEGPPPEYETPPEHLESVHRLREWIEKEVPTAAKRICIKPCGFGYSAGMGENLKPGELLPSFDLQLRNLTAEEVKKIGRYVESL